MFQLYQLVQVTILLGFAMKKCNFGTAIQQPAQTHTHTHLRWVADLQETFFQMEHILHDFFCHSSRACSARKLNSSYRCSNECACVSMTTPPETWPAQPLALGGITRRITFIRRPSAGLASLSRSHLSYRGHLARWQLLSQSWEELITRVGLQTFMTLAACYKCNYPIQKMLMNMFISVD